MHGSMRPLPVFLLLFLLLSYWVWTSAPQPAGLPKAELPAEHWKLPTFATSDAQRPLAILAAGSVWGKVADNLPPPLPAWGVAGIMGRGEEKFVIIKVDGRDAQQLTVGDLLPDGGVVLGIGDGDILAETEGVRRAIPFYRKAETK